MLQRRGNDLGAGKVQLPVAKTSASDKEVIAVSARSCQSLWRVRSQLLVLLSLGICGCTSLSRSTVNEMQLALTPRPDVAPAAAEVASRPYYQLQATSANGSAVLILGNVDGARQAWYGANETVIFLEQGRVVKTHGLSQNLDGLQASDNDPFVHGLQNLRARFDYRRVEDWSPGYRYGVIVDAELVPAGTEQISILGVEHKVLRVDEKISAPDARYRATNHYWVDPQDGFIWQSEQHVLPGLTLKLTQLKPYREMPL